MVTFLLKLTFGLTLGGVIAYDLVMVGTTQLALEDQAYAAARAAADAYHYSHNQTQALAAAQASAVQADPANVVEADYFVIGAQGTVQVGLERTPVTVLARHIPRLRDWLDVTATASATPMP